MGETNVSDAVKVLLEHIYEVSINLKESQRVEILCIDISRIFKIEFTFKK